MSMRLDTLKIRNFKGVKNFTLAAGCTDQTILGDNGTGKSTIKDALNWLLFDKDSRDQGQFGIKPTGKVGSEQKAVECEVEATFVNDTSVTLRKIYKEKWTKKRGSLNSEMTGHTVDYYVDGVPAKMKEYKEKVAEIATREDVFRLLTSVTYFNETIKKDDRRRMLFELVPGVSDESIIASDPDLSTLPGILDGKSIDERKKVITAARTKIEKDVKSIPDRVDEQDRSKPENLEVTNAQGVINKLTKLRSALDRKNQEIADIKAGGGLAMLRSEVDAAKRVTEDIERKHSALIEASVANIQKELNTLKDNRAEISRTIHSLVGEKTLAEEDIANLKETNEKLREQWKAISGEQLESDVCPTCLQTLPADQLEAVVARLNESKATRLESNQEKGKANAAKIKVLSISMADIEEKLAGETAKAQEHDTEIAKLESQLSLMEKDAGNAKETKEYKAALVTLEKLKKRIEAAEKDSSEIVEKLVGDKSAIQADIEIQEKHLSKIEQVQDADTRIAELKAEEKKLSAKYEKLSGHLNVIETFERAKCSAVEDSINGMFEITKWKLFEEQINGGINQVCEATLNGVAYTDMSNGERIRVGLDIIKTFSKYYNFAPPVLIDNRESVTEIPDMDCQVINLVVSKHDKVLRVVQQHIGK